jgi:hypothetical protein
MRANEFVTEGKKGSPPKHHHNAQPGAYRFIDDATDRYYHLNQIMKAAACADGRSTKAIDMDDESFAGKNNLAYPYSELEHKMMKQAFKSVRGNHSEKFIKSHKSLESEDTHKISPIKAFKGYK